MRTSGLATRTTSDTGALCSEDVSGAFAEGGILRHVQIRAADAAAANANQDLARPWAQVFELSHHKRRVQALHHSRAHQRIKVST